MLPRRTALLLALCGLVLKVSSAQAQGAPPSLAEMAHAAQRNKTSQPARTTEARAPNPLQETANKYPELLPEFGRLFDKLQHNVTFPPDRTESRLMPLLPASTIGYLAVPNFGGVARQALTIFQQELNNSPDLRAWWVDSGMAAQGPMIEDSLDRFSKVSEYLGDEIVISGVLDAREPDLLILSEVRRPGLKEVLQEAVLTPAAKSKPGMRILDAQELATAIDAKPQDLVVLVRPDFVIASNNVARLRSFSLDLDRGKRDFPSTAFGQRILQSYAAGVSWLGALDLQKLVALAPKDPSLATFRQTGFADVKYAVWEHKQTSGRGISQSELSFTGPRRGVAAWLAAPRQMSSLEFVSPQAMFAVALALKNPAQIFDDIRQLSDSNPKAMASVAQMEQALGISLQDDVLAQLSGEVTVELDSVASQPAWRVILGVKDPDRFQQTLDTILSRARVAENESSEAGLRYHTLRVPSAQGSNLIAYAFSGRYLLIASSPDALSEAVRLHNNGQSLARSRRFLDSLPSGQKGVSALLYEDPSAMMALQMQRLSPGQAQSMTQLMGKSTPVVMCVYGEQDAIRETSGSPGVDAGVVLVGAAIAIPNLLRARIAANEASALGNLRDVNSAQFVYAARYSDHGFAPDLATLGVDPTNKNRASAAHAALIGKTLGKPDCDGNNWCESSGYRFILKGSCTAERCRDFVAVATPLTSSTGNRTFCSTADGIIRYQGMPTISATPTPRDCKQWAPFR